jgi:hypothetical protein
MGSLLDSLQLCGSMADGGGLVDWRAQSYAVNDAQGPFTAIVANWRTMLASLA